MPRITEYLDGDILVMEVETDLPPDGGDTMPLGRIIEVAIPGPAGRPGNGGGISPIDHGAVVDGDTDDAGALQAAIDALPAEGGTIAMPPGVMAIASTIIVSKPNVLLQGLGGDNRHNTSPFIFNAGTRLKWTGAAGGTMLRFMSPPGASNPKMTGGGIKGVVLDAAASAGHCLKILSWNSARFEDLLLYDATVACLAMNVVASLADARDPQENIFERLVIAALSGSADGIHMESDTPGANPSYNTFIGALIYVANGTGVNLFNCDNNWFDHIRIFVTGAGNAVQFNGSNVSATYVSRDNVFDHLTTVAPIIARGTPSFTYPAGRNSTWNMDQTNNTVQPTIEAGTRLSYSYLDGASYMLPHIKAISAQTEAQANAAFDEFTGGSNASHIIVNDSNAHILLRNSSRTIAWVIGVDQISGSVNWNIASGGTAATLNFSRPVRPAVTTVAGLASFTGNDPGRIAYATNGRKPGEGAGAGTGVLVSHDGTAWRDPTGATVQA